MADSEVTIFSQSLSTQKSTCSDDESPEQELQQLSPDLTVTIPNQSSSTQKSTCSDDESPEQESRQQSPGETNVNADKGIFFII